MPRRAPQPCKLTNSQARRIWLRAQRLDTRSPFGGGPEATVAAVRHLGYVQIDTINVIERSHHHILYTRIPEYRREHLHQAESVDKTVFEYWTHALSYLPTEAIRFYVGEMRRHRREGHAWFNAVKDREMRKVLRRIRMHGPLSIRDITDDVLVEKDHAWASRKPSKRALELAFYMGRITISHRAGIVKTYELINRHFGWERMPRAASDRERREYLLDRALRAQGIISLDSTCHLNAPQKKGIARLIHRRVRRGELVPVELEGASKWEHWVEPQGLEVTPAPADDLVHILSPFDPLIIQRKRLKLFFDYDHRFEAYVPKAKRAFGYFVCPVLMGDRVVAGLDLKTDRERQKLLVQKWNWFGRRSERAPRAPVEEALHRFEKFQVAG
jgi:uncharacterized protein YcaQ